MVYMEYSARVTRLASCVNANISEDVAGGQVTGGRRQVNDGRREKTTTRRDGR